MVTYVIVFFAAGATDEPKKRPLVLFDAAPFSNPASPKLPKSTAPPSDENVK